MANIPVKSGNDILVYLNTAGTGTITDPYTPQGGSVVLTAIASTIVMPVSQSGTWTLTSSGSVGINAINVTVPISAAALPLPSGASTAAKQPALGTAGTASADVITVQGIASMTALKVDGSAVTQPVSAASLPLPSGAATSALQPGFGTAGTPSANVSSIQGVASGTPVPISGSVGLNANNVILPVSQSGTWTVQPGNTPNTTPWLVRTQAVSGSVVTPAPATAATYTWSAAGGGVSHVLDRVIWSYNATPTGGSLTIADGATILVAVDITSGGPGFIDVGFLGTTNTAMTITLASGSTGVTGKLGWAGKRTV